MQIEMTPAAVDSVNPQLTPGCCWLLLFAVLGGAFVYRLGHGPLKAERRVRFPYALPLRINCVRKSAGKSSFVRLRELSVRQGESSLSLGSHGQSTALDSTLKGPEVRLSSAKRARSWKYSVKVFCSVFQDDCVWRFSGTEGWSTGGTAQRNDLAATTGLQRECWRRAWAIDAASSMKLRRIP